MAGSSEAINYSIRPNKSVERKLIVEALSEMTGLLNLPEYRYIGMGAMWFIDFTLIHRFLRIGDMISMEMENHERADFNRPLSCIKVMGGESTTLLKQGALPITDKKLLVWFDYDGLASDSVLTDLRMVLLEAQVGCIVVATVNAHKNNYIRMDEKDQRLPIKESMQAAFGSLVPDPFPKDGHTWLGFQKLLADVLMNHMNHEVVKGRAPLEFMPLFNFGYEDNSPMVTVGGILCDADLRAKLSASPVKSPYVGSGHININVPPLTFREKLEVDRFLPQMQTSFNLLDPESREEHAELEQKFHTATKLRLKAPQISDYAKFYKHYPVFWDASS